MKSKFEEWFQQQSFYLNLRFIHGDQLFIFEGDGNVQIYSGNYTDYRLEQEEPKKPSKAENKAAPIAAHSEITKRKLSFKEEKERSELEISIKELEHQTEVLTSELNSGITDHNKLTDIANKIKEIKDKIDEQTFRWLELSE